MGGKNYNHKNYSPVADFQKSLLAPDPFSKGFEVYDLETGELEEKFEDKGNAIDYVVRTLPTDDKPFLIHDKTKSENIAIIYEGEIFYKLR